MTEVGGLTLGHMLRLSGPLRHCGEDARSMEEAAAKVLDVLVDGLACPDGSSPIALARFYRTMRAAHLGDELFPVAAASGELDPETLCLVLLASRGVEEAWNDRRRSVAHRAIPLRSAAALEQSPMIAGLLDRFEATSLVAGQADEVSERERFNVFHVEEAAGSPLVPAQDFVDRYGIRSVVGFGGFLPPADLFATILFFTIPVDEPTAELFGPLGLSVKLAVLDHANDQRVFA